LRNNDLKKSENNFGDRLFSRLINQHVKDMTASSVDYETPVGMSTYVEYVCQEELDIATERESVRQHYNSEQEEAEQLKLEVVTKFVDSLSEENTTLFYMRYGQQLSLSEIADNLGIAKTTAFKRIKKLEKECLAHIEREAVKTVTAKRFLEAIKLNKGEV